MYRLRLHLCYNSVTSLQQRLHDLQQETVYLSALKFTPSISNVMVNVCCLHLLSFCCLMCPLHLFPCAAIFWRSENFYVISPYALSGFAVISPFCVLSHYLTVYLYHILPQQYTILYAVFDNILSFPFPGLFDIGVMYFTSTYVIKPEMFVLFLLQGI